MKLKHVAAGIGTTLLFAGGGSVVADNAINPYQTVGTTLEDSKAGSLSESGTNTLSIDTTQPKIGLSKWDGKVALGVTYTGIQATGARPFLSKNVEWKEGNQTMEAVPLDATTDMEDGGAEINIILDTPPPTNVFTFQLDNWQDLNFLYQAPLWQQTGLKAPTDDCTDTDCITSQGTIHRDENVVDSYAVYYKDHKDHILGQTNYATGKAYHIFRPLVTDNTGNTVWADLSYANGVLTVTVPQKFLDNASYPVKVDPTFGNTSAGNTSTSQAANAFYSGLDTPASNGTVTSISIYLNSSGANWKGIIIDGAAKTIIVNGITPGSTLANNGLKTQYTTNYVSSPTIVGGTPYYVGAVINAAGTYYFDSGVGSFWFNSPTNYTTPTDPTGGVGGVNYPSMFATYTAAAVNTAVGTPSVKMMTKMTLNGKLSL